MAVQDGETGLVRHRGSSAAKAVLRKEQREKCIEANEFRGQWRTTADLRFLFEKKKRPMRI
jgi:hypothetical protein